MKRPLHNSLGSRAFSSGCYSNLSRLRVGPTGRTGKNEPHSRDQLDKSFRMVLVTSPEPIDRKVPRLLWDKQSSESERERERRVSS